MNIDFDPLALLELNDAVDYYNFQLEGLGARFKDDIKQGLKKISDHPFSAQINFPSNAQKNYPFMYT